MQIISEITAALPLSAQLRRCTLAVVAAADFAAVLYTDAPPAGEAESIEPSAAPIPKCLDSGLSQQL